MVSRVYTLWRIGFTIGALISLALILIRPVGSLDFWAYFGAVGGIFAALSGVFFVGLAIGERRVADAGAQRSYANHMVLQLLYRLFSEVFLAVAVAIIALFVAKVPFIIAFLKVRPLSLLVLADAALYAIAVLGPIEVIWRHEFFSKYRDIQVPTGTPTDSDSVSR